MFWEHLLCASGGVQNMSPWHKDYFELKIFEIQQLQEETFSSLPLIFLKAKPPQLIRSHKSPSRSFTTRDNWLLSLKRKSKHRCIWIKIHLNRSIQFSSVQFSRSFVSTLWDPMNHSTPGLPVHHQLPEFTQTHVHWVGDAIQASHPLLSPSPPAPNPSQNQGLFQWVNSSHEVAKVLEFQL